MAVEWRRCVFCRGKGTTARGHGKSKVTAPCLRCGGAGGKNVSVPDSHPLPKQCRRCHGRGCARCSGRGTR